MNFKKFRFLTYISIILLVFMSGCADKPKEVKEDNSDETAVQIVKPVFRDYQETLTLPGVTDAPTVTQVGFMVSGTVEEILVDVGQKVQKGQLLARLDQKVYRAQVNTAASQVNLSSANLNKTLAGSRNQEIGMAKNQMLQAKAAYEHAKTEMERYKAVYRLDAVPKQQYDSVMSQYLQAQQQYMSAKNQYSLTREGASKEDKQIAVANVGVAASSLDQAQVQLGYTHLTSPMDGVIAVKAVEKGTVVNAGTPVFQIQSTGSIDLVINVPSMHITKVPIGQKTKVSFLNWPDKKFSAVVREIQPITDDMTRSYRVKLRIVDPLPGPALTGTIGDAVFYTGQKSRAAFVPISCLQKQADSDDFTVFVVNSDNTVKRIKIKMHKMINENAMISGPFKDDVSIVVSGQEYLKDSQKVRVVKALDSLQFVTRDREPGLNDVVDQP